MTNKIKLVYVAHPYGGNPENAEAVQKIIESLTSGDHPLVAGRTPNDNIPVFDMPSMCRRSISRDLCTKAHHI